MYNENKDGTLKLKKYFNFDLYKITLELGYKDKRPGFFLRILNCGIEFFYRSCIEGDGPEVRQDL